MMVNPKQWARYTVLLKRRSEEVQGLRRQLSFVNLSLEELAQAIAEEEGAEGAPPGFPWCRVFQSWIIRQERGHHKKVGKQMTKDPNELYSFQVRFM